MNLSEYTPEEYAGKFIARDSGKSILDSALKQWFDSSSVTSAVGKWKKANKNKKLDDLKKNRPGLVPSKFVFITEGAAGLAVREYIQSEKYQGEIANVVFFNTPHEGAGIADQSMFNGTSILEKDDDATKYGTIISLALVAYVAGGVNGLQDLMISLLKDAVMGMAYNMGGISEALEKSKVFTDYDSLGASKFYLAMDADEKDDKYKDLIDSMEKSGVDAKMNIGATQLLNSFTMKTNFEAPLYNNVFSHGMPTIGNGRRTLEDFADQSKDHVSVEKMKKVLADTLKAKAREYYKESGLDSIANVEELVNMYKDLKKLKDTPEMFKDLAQDSLKNLSQAAKDSLKSMRSEVLDSLYSKLDDVAGDLLDELESSGAMDYVDDVLDTYSEVKGFMKEYHVVEYIQGVNKLRSYKFNKDDIPGSIMELVSIVDKFIPKEYKNEVYSLFVEYFTPETRAALSKYGSCALDGRKMRDCAKEGLKLVASNLANYSLNFFDEGTFDIPVYSALGENVAAFKEAAVQKFGIPIDSLVKVYHDIKDSVNDYRNTFKGYKKTLKNQFDSLHKYQTLLKDIGELEVDRQIVDLALNIGCKALNEVNPAYGKICSAAEFATNVGLVAYTTSMVKDLVGQSGVLKYSKDLALFSSVADTV